MALLVKKCHSSYRTSCYIRVYDADSECTNLNGSNGIPGHVSEPSQAHRTSETAAGLGNTFSTYNYSLYVYSVQVLAVVPVDVRVHLTLSTWVPGHDDEPRWTGPVTRAIQ